MNSHKNTPKQTGETAHTPETIGFQIPKKMWISSNDRLHHHAKAAKTKQLRHLAHATATHAIRNGHATPREKIRLLDIAVGYPTRRRADPPNSYPTVKALIDGCTDAGLWPDDNSEIIAAHLFRRDPIPAPKGTHTIRLTLP